MKSYCVKEKRETSCVPNTEQMMRTSNGRTLMKCKCASCGITKTQFLKGQQTGGAVEFSCGTNLRGKRAGTAEECLRIGQVRRHGLNAIDQALL